MADGFMKLVQRAKDKKTQTQNENPNVEPIYVPAPEEVQYVQFHYLPWGEENEPVALYYPGTMPMTNELNTSLFSIIELVQVIAKRVMVKLIFRMTGYNNDYNFVCLSDPFMYHGLYHEMIIRLVDGLPEVAVRPKI